MPQPHKTVNMSEIDDKKLHIVGTLKEKSLLKQKVYDNTFHSFSMVKEILKSLSKEMNVSIWRYRSED